MEYKQLEEALKTFNDDLLKTRQELQKLNVSINYALKQIKQKLPNRSAVETFLRQKEIVPLGSKSLSYSPLKQISQQHPFRCDKCFIEISNPQKFLSNKQKKLQSKCQLCNQTYYESFEHHQQYICGQKLVCCQNCGLEVERKSIDKHVKICNFRSCFKCNKKIYLKAFAFHLKVCKKQATRTVSTKKQTYKENIPNLSERKKFF